MTAALSPGNATATASIAKPRRKSKLKWWVIGGSVLVAALVALAIVKKRGANVGISVTTEKAVTKTIVQTVTATGKVQPEVEVKINPEVYGEIIALPFREGASVKKGDVIVKIKPDFYQAAGRPADGGRRRSALWGRQQHGAAREGRGRPEEVPGPLRPEAGLGFRLRHLQDRL